MARIVPLAPAPRWGSYTGRMSDKSSINSSRPGRSRPLDPRKLDIEAMARDAVRLQGRWPAEALARLAEFAPAEAPISGWPVIEWSAQAELRAQRGAEPQLWLHLQAHAEVSLSCQRCLQPVAQTLALDSWVRFVRDEELAASLDADSEEDVLSLQGRLDLQELVEDELLLALPLVPRHERCPQPLPMSSVEPDVEVEPEKPNPFAVLAALKGKGGA